MRRWFVIIMVAWLVTGAVSASAETGKVVKVLPFFLDLKGHHALSPSLYDRDAYQAQLRNAPEKRSAIRFDVKWKYHDAGFGPLTVRMELRGVAVGNLPRQATLEQKIKNGKTSDWTSLTLKGEEYKKLGEVTAWRATLWEGDRLLSEQKSFLW